MYVVRVDCPFIPTARKTRETKGCLALSTGGDGGYDGGGVPL